jgi:hypothetical protein
MLHSFESIDFFLYSIETEIINSLYEYKLLEKFDKNTKKIFFFLFVKNFTEKIKTSSESHIFYYDKNLSDSHELFNYYSKIDVQNFIEKILNKMKKMTNKIIFLKQKTTLPETSFISELDGSVVDELMLLQQKKPANPKELKSFLKENNLKDLFSSLSKKLC